MIRDFLKRLRRDRSGVAMVEFAVSLPVLLTFGLGGLEIARYGIATSRVSELAMLTADNASRVRDRIDEVDVNQVMTGVRLIGESIGFTEHGRVILSSMQPNAAANGQWIRWQRCVGKFNRSSAYGTEGKGQNDASLAGMGPSTRRIAALPGTAVMFVEVFYEYQPIVGEKLFGHRVLHFERAFNVRQRNDQVIYNATSMANNRKSLCSVYTA